MEPAFQESVALFAHAVRMVAAFKVYCSGNETRCWESGSKEKDG
jgi:hypothetical protein